MPKQLKLAILSEPDVGAALADAWRDSYPGPTGGHEEGGLILRDLADKLSVLCWPKGAQDEGRSLCGRIGDLTGDHLSGRYEWTGEQAGKDERDFGGRLAGGGMSVTLTAEVLQDEIAVSLARVVAVANQRARAAGVDLLQSFISITQGPFNGGTIWRINYGPKNYIGRRGGDLIVEVDPDTANVQRVLRGQ